MIILKSISKISCCSVICYFALLASSDASTSSTSRIIMKPSLARMVNATLIEREVSGFADPQLAQASTSDKTLNSKKLLVGSKIELPITAMRQHQDLQMAAGHKKYHLVKKKPKTKKIKMEVYEPKMKYKKIKMKVPIKVLKKKKVKGYMVKKKHY